MKYCLAKANLVRKVFCLVILKKENEILLGFKKRGLGMGKWNGFGGKLEEGETPIEAAIREMKEESGLELSKCALEKIGFLEFTFEDKPNLLEVHIYTTNTFSGNLIESDEMLPKWFKISELPYDNMWPDDKIWYPLMFQNKAFKGSVHFQGENNILSHDIQEVDSL